MAEPGPLDAIAYIHINLFGGGEMSVSGNIGDKRLALGMLNNAIDVIKTKRQYRGVNGVMVPYQDVVVEAEPTIPLTPYGEMSPSYRPVIDMPTKV